MVAYLVAPVAHGVHLGVPAPAAPVFLGIVVVVVVVMLVIAMVVAMMVTVVVVVVPVAAAGLVVVGVVMVVAVIVVMVMVVVMVVVMLLGGANKRVSHLVLDQAVPPRVLRRHGTLELLPAHEACYNAV